jgi:hypothetical protein
MIGHEIRNLERRAQCRRSESTARSEHRYTREIPQRSGHAIGTQIVGRTLGCPELIHEKAARCGFFIGADTKPCYRLIELRCMAWKPRLREETLHISRAPWLPT